VYTAGGKTALLELLAQLSSKRLWGPALCIDASMRDILNASIPITVTFNAEMPAKPSAYDADPETGLALRILYSALVRSRNLTFVDFWREFFPLGSTLDVQTAMKCCQLAFQDIAPARSGILLLVDETVKLVHDSSRASANCMLTALGSLLSCYNSRQLNAVCSTLDAMLLNAHRTSSGRFISYVPLPEITQDAAEAMFAEALGVVSVPLDSSPLLPGRQLPPALRIAISDCAGHLRTLERLLFAAQATAPVFDLNGLRRRTVAKLAGATPWWAVLAALRGNTLKLTDVVPGSNGVILCDAITAGTFINTSAIGKNPVVPKLSMMYLLRFAEEEGEESPYLAPILGMAAAEESAAGLQRPSLGGALFEDFVGHLLRLITALEAGSDRRVHQLLHVSLVELADTGIPKPVRELLLRPCSHRSRHLQLVAHWPLATFRDAASNTTGTYAALTDAGIFTFHKDNPSFDLLYLSAPSSDAENRFALAIEARITTPVGSASIGEADSKEHKDNLGEVDRKVRDFFVHCTEGEAFAKLAVKRRNILYVYLAARTIAGFDTAARQAYLAKGVVVLDRNATEVFLTPTLSSCLLFQERV
jgi:hypothetical protein